jgi:hypothetical protein
MNVDPDKLKKLISDASFESHGDRHEKSFGYFFSDSFPRCERFWQLFVVPLTRRMEGYPGDLSSDIRFRPEIAPQVQAIAAAHYSMFAHLVFAHIHLEKKMISALEDIYIHLASTCDLADAVAEKWYLLLARCREEEVYTLQKQSREEFLAHMGKWYDKEYPRLYEHWLSKSKPPSLGLKVRKCILKEYFDSSGCDAAKRKDYVTTSRLIRTFRNRMVHNVRVAKVDLKDGRTLVPKTKKINEYKTWQQVEAAAQNPALLEKDFVEQFTQSAADITSLETTLDRLWIRIIGDFEVEFFSEDRSALRDAFGLEFSPETDVSDYVAAAAEMPDPLSNIFASGEDTAASGIYNERLASESSDRDDADEGLLTTSLI